MTTKALKNKLLIAEDEPLTMDRICGLLQAYPGFEVVAKCGNGLEAIQAIKSHKPDVVLMDIKMPLLDGFEVLQQLHGNEYKVLVFITAYDEYAIRAFENEALDYLLKPFDEGRFHQLMTRVKKQLKFLEGEEKSAIMIKAEGTIIRVSLDHIIYIRAEGNYVQLHLEQGMLRTRALLGNIEELLDDRFTRIHRSYIINTSRIIKMKHLCQGDYVFAMSNGKSINSSRQYRPGVKLLLPK